MEKSLIKINNCRIEKSKGTVLERLDWEMKAGEAWLVIGPNGGGKADFLKMLAGSTLTEQVQIAVNSADSSGTDGSYFNLFENSTLFPLNGLPVLFNRNEKKMKVNLLKAA